MNRSDGQKWRAGVLGATGMVGQRFVKLLADHPWFLGTQFHAEYRSRPNRPHPLYRSFVAAVLRRVKHPATPRPKEASQPAANR